MNINEATDIVTTAALQQANSSFNAAEIFAAVDLLRIYIADHDEPGQTLLGANKLGDN